VAELGQRLRQARESLGLSLDDVEESTRIRRVFIEALEEDRFDALPGAVYARGFLRNYARLLGLDAGELLQEFEAATGTSSTHVPQVLDQPLARPSRIGRWIGTLLIVLLVGAVSVAGWYGYNRLFLDIDPFAPSNAPASAIGPTATPTTTPTPGAIPMAPELDERLTPTAALEQTPQPTPTATVTPTPSPTPILGIVVEARLIAPTYVELTLDGESAFIGTLQAGEDRVWTAQERVQMRLGNAGGIEFTVNGVEVGAPGTPGQVLDVEYTLDTLPQDE
jgi:cytoskeletal protein RodZ